MSDLLTVEELETHTLITMDDGKANALSFAMLDALGAALDKASTDKPLVLAGRPGKFSAGFDLAVMSRGDEGTVRLLRQGAETAVRLLKFEAPVVLAVTGHALAMGALLCLSADYRLGVRGNFKLGLNEVVIGMTLPWFGVELARARIAENHLNDAVSLAHIYDPDTAAAVGYLDDVADEEEFSSRLETVIEGLGKLDMKAHRETKVRVRELLFQRLELGLQRDFEGIA